MRDILPNTIALYSLIKSALISIDIGRLRPLFSLENYKNRYFCIVIQLLIEFSREISAKKSFPLITAMGPSGPITHC